MLTSVSLVMVYRAKGLVFFLSRCTWYCWGETDVWGDPVRIKIMRKGASTEHAVMLTVFQED